MVGQFHLEFTDARSNARAGTLSTAHGDISTPVFMPVGTQATVKGVPQDTLRDLIDARIILANTYHLYLRPGIEVISAAGGVHKFMGWDRPLLTDSGGYQVYSLSQMRKITEEGVSFQSHLDGSRHFIRPEDAIDIQRQIGADIIMAFDECTPYPCAEEYARKSMHLTHRWLDRCLQHVRISKNHYGHDQIFAPIVQGSTYHDLRKQSAEYIAAQQCKINAIGGLSVGEPAHEMYAMTDVVCQILPTDKPRYLMGVGTPANILECIALGVDMFDCVLPSRNGRHGLLYTKNGIINIRNEKWKNDHNAIDPDGSPWSQVHSKAYLRHLIHTREMLGSIIATVHNLWFYLDLVREARERIINGTFASWLSTLTPELSRRI